MIVVERFDVDELKEEMRVAKVFKTLRPSTIEKRFARNNDRLQVEIQKNKILSCMYSPSKTLPVKVAGLVINYLLYQSFLKKLKGYKTELTITSNSIQLKYWKFGSLSKGVMNLEDISYYFDGFKHIPRAEIVENGS